MSEMSELKIIVDWKGHPINTWCYEIVHAPKTQPVAAETVIKSGVNFWGPTGFINAAAAAVQDMADIAATRDENGEVNY